MISQLLLYLSVFGGVCLVVALVLFVRMWIRSEYTLIQAMYWAAAKLLAVLLWRTRVENVFPRVSGSGAVVICNHRSSIDPFFVQTSVYHVIHWMVAGEYFRLPGVGWFLRNTEAIPVNRGGVDTAATRAAIRHVADGKMVGMFPEGRINESTELMRSVRPGAIVVALKGRGQIVPCYIAGAPYRGTVWSPFFTRARVRVRFGEPIDLSPYFGQERDAEVVQQLLARSVRAIAELAGQRDFEPVLAGRHWKPDEDE